MSLHSTDSGIKVHRLPDANETVEMLFHAASRGEPVAFSVVRPPVPVFQRGFGIPLANAEVNGACVFRKYSENGKKKHPSLCAAGREWRT